MYLYISCNYWLLLLLLFVVYFTDTCLGGSTSWSSTAVIWSGRRYLVESMSDDMSSAVGTSDEVDRVQRSLSTSLPPWCSYYGVTCGTVSGSATYESVTSIALSGLSLTGTIPSSIGSLTSLQYLKLKTNNLNGTIPSSIGSLTSLTTLDLQFNQLTGTIPSSFSNLISLSSLYLDYNYLTMGSATTVPASTFSSKTLSRYQSGYFSLSNNCLAFSYNSTSVSATHCAPTSGKSLVLCEYEYEYVSSRKAASCLRMTWYSVCVLILCTADIYRYSPVRMTLTSHVNASMKYDDENHYY